MIKNKLSENNFELKILKKFDRLSKKLTFSGIIVNFINLTIVISIFLSPVLGNIDQIKVNAQSEKVTYNTMYVDDGDGDIYGACITRTGTATLSGVDLENFNEGRRVYSPSVGNIFKSSLLNSCCYEMILHRYETGSLSYIPATLEELTNSNCVGVPIQEAGNGTPWYITDNGNFQTSFGAFPIQNILENNQVLGPNGSRGGAYSKSDTNTKLSEYLFATTQDFGTYPPFSNPPGTWSYRGMDVMGIENVAAFPPDSLNSRTWFDYLVRLVSINLKDNDESPSGNADNMQSIQAGGGGLTIAGNITNTLAPNNNTPNTTTFYIQGDVNIQPGRCNGKRLVFVDGDLTITPNFVIDEFQNPEKGCYFIVSGNTTIKAGDEAKNGTADAIDIGLYTNMETLIEYDDRLLFMNGSLAGVGLNIQRSNADYERNNPPDDLEPSFNLFFDPRYSELFAREMRITNFSTREKGFNEGI